MDNTQHRRASLRRLALWCAGLLLVVTSLSAFIRLSQAGLGCEPWPMCYGSALRAAQGDAQPVQDSIAVTAARSAHRVIATVALAGVVTMVALCFIGSPRLLREGMLALVLLALVLGLAVLGLWTRGSRVPAVALGNLLGGFMMLAVAARLVGPSAVPGLRAAAAGVAVLLVAQSAVGALVSASQAGLVCNDLRACAELARAAGWHWQALNPWLAAGLPPVDGALVQGLHRLAAIVVTVAVVALGWRALRAGRRPEGWALLLLLALQAVLGLVVGSIGLPLWAVLLHNLTSALLLALVVRLI